MWLDHLPEAQKADESTMVHADGKIDQLMKDQEKMQFEADSLALARDASALAHLYKEEQSSERAERMAKVMHLKQQNNIGSNIVMQHMAKYSNHICAVKNDLLAHVEKAISVNLP